MQDNFEFKTETGGFNMACNQKRTDSTLTFLIALSLLAASIATATVFGMSIFG
ncbi:hypothetical protein [Brucella anthropi]|uniref:hypothetical protein n=1 Tax=Brucella anthropi TaxID=529 RepID=UPI00244D5F50|nr:hypothetical protein [Brucella anthropi]MDH0366757.1 hypothetical protein [Brucella anthropi]